MGNEQPEGQTWLYWWRKGLARIIGVPAFSLMASFIGFGTLCRDVGLDLGHALAMTFFIWALPAQVVVVGALISGLSLPATVIAVCLSSVRFVPMTASWVPIVRGPQTRRLTLFAMSQFLAITSWVETMTRLRDVPRPWRMAYFTGFGMTLTLINMGTASIGYWLAGAMPPLIAAGLVFIMPAYFLLSLTGAARHIGDRAAVISGVLIGPFMAMLDPELDLLWSGLCGGTVAFALWRLSVSFRKEAT